MADIKNISIDNSGCVLTTTDNLKRRVSFEDFIKIYAKQTESALVEYNVPPCVHKISTKKEEVRYHFIQEARWWNVVYTRDYEGRKLKAFKIWLPKLLVVTSYEKGNMIDIKITTVDGKYYLDFPNFYSSGYVCIGKFKSNNNPMELKEDFLRFMMAPFNGDLWEHHDNEFESIPKMFKWLETKRKDYSKILKEVR